MLRHYKYQRLVSFMHQLPRLVSSTSDNKSEGTVNINKLVGFLKKAEERIVHPTEKLAVSAMQHIVETPKSPTHLPSISDPKKGEDGNERRQSSAPRLVPWTSNRFLVEYRVTKSPVSLIENKKSFATLLRESTFVELGNFNQREVIGVVIENVDDSDLYIDFGGKFLAVVSQPDGSFYPRGSLVRIRLRDPEMANRFMINTKAISLLEADATLIGPYRGQVFSQSVDSNAYLPFHTPKASVNSISHIKMNKEAVCLEHWKMD